MTPAEYARSQGWRVGDLLDTQHGKQPVEVTAMGRRWVLMSFPMNTDGIDNEWIWVRQLETGYQRIGRVLRPEGR